MKIGSSFACDSQRAGQIRNRSAAGKKRTPATSGPSVALQGVSLRFCVYSDKTLSLKRAALGWVLRRLRALWRRRRNEGTSQNNPHPVPDGGLIYGQRHGSQFWALRDVALSIAAGERVGIVGHNGAGKTTLLKLMARIYTPTRGRVSVRGRIAPLMDLGAAFNGELSARDNILLHGALLGFDRRTMLRRMGAILEFADVAEFADLQVKYFSSGMSARLAFSIATDVDPEILLVDEVFATGDANFRDKATARMRALMGRSGIVVMSSHDLKLVESLCSRVVLLQHGRVVVDGAPRTVLEQYKQQIRQSQQMVQTPPLERGSVGIEMQSTHSPSDLRPMHVPLREIAPRQEAAGASVPPGDRAT